MLEFCFQKHCGPDIHIKWITEKRTFNNYRWTGTLFTKYVAFTDDLRFKKKLSCNLGQQQRHQTIDERLNKAICTVLAPVVYHGHPDDSWSILLLLDQIMLWSLMNSCALFCDELMRTLMLFRCGWSFLWVGKESKTTRRNVFEAFDCVKSILCCPQLFICSLQCNWLRRLNGFASLQNSFKRL